MRGARTSAIGLCALIVSFAGSGCSRHNGPSLTATAQSNRISIEPPANSHDNWRSAGISLQGRPIRVRTLGHGPRRVLFIGGIHGDEAEGAYATSQLPAAFAASGLGDVVTLTILEDANPDGRANRTRDNVNGVDLNRNFPATNFDPSNVSSGGSPVSQPESRAVVDTIEHTVPQLIMIVHSWTDQQFINFDGPARAIAERFSATSEIPVMDSSLIPPTPGSLGSYAGRDRRIPVLTIEFRKGSDPLADWGLIKVAVIEVIRGD